MNVAVNERWCDFGPLRVGYDDMVLAPRPWTIVQSRHAAALLVDRPAGPVLELHCGAGHIGQAAAAWTGRSLVQVDDDSGCCEWAAHNAALNGVDASVVCSDAESVPLRDASFALVLADPPYVPTSDTVRFPEDPRHAIDGGDDGLAGFRACLPAASRLLRPGGAIVVQVWGPRQAAAVGELVDEHHPLLSLADVVTVSSTRAVIELERR